MSMHLVECVRALDLQPSAKLALVAFADSADTITRHAMPGFEAVQQWAGVSRARTYELIGELEALGLIRQETRGHRGRRATYTVFPAGCCEQHATVVEATDAQQDTRALLEQLAASGVELTDEQRRALAGDPTAPVAIGSGTSDPNGLEASVSPGQNTEPNGRVRPVGPNQPTPTDTAERVQPVGPNEEKGSGKGPAQSGPLPNFNYNPPTPSRAGGACSKHPDKPGDSCRACGTSPRQLATTHRRRADAERRAREQAAHAAAREQRASTAVPTDAVDPALRAAARDRIRQARLAATAGRPA